MRNACYDPRVPSLQIKNVPEEVLLEVRRRAAQRHVSIRDYLLALILADQRAPTLEDWLDGVRGVDPITVPAAEVAASVANGRAERDETVAGAEQRDA